MNSKALDKNNEIICKNDLIKIGTQIFKVFDSGNGLFIKLGSAKNSDLNITFLQDIRRDYIELFYKDEEPDQPTKNGVNPKYKKILQWSRFSDNNVADIPVYIFQYFQENQNSFTPMQAYELAILACECQYNLRVLRSRELKQHVTLKQHFTTEQININNTWIESIFKFEGLIDYVLAKKVNNGN